MSKELVMNLYEQMVNTKDVAEAKVIKNMYDNQDYKNDTITKYFNKKCSELKINEFSKHLNSDNIGLATDCRIDIVKMEDRLFPIITLLDNDNNSLQIGLSIDVLNKITKQVQGTKAGMSYLEYVGC